MIQPVIEIEKGKGEQRKAYRMKIRNEIRSAMEQNISKFEFVGDEYKYSTLAQMAREEANRLIREITYNWLNNQSSDYKSKIRPIMHYIVPKAKIITISSTKNKETGKIRVFCEINPDIDDEIRRAADLEIKASELRRSRKNHELARIVRCKNCIYFQTERCAVVGNVNPEWYCAKGEANEF